MKTSMAYFCAATGLICSLWSGNAAPEIGAQILDRGAHHRKWANVTVAITAGGQTETRTNRYTELATGLHYRQGDQWVESEEVIDIVAGGALASQGPHQVGFAANINTLGAINLLTSDNKRFRSHVLGLAYTDARTGQSVLIAGIRDSVGELVGENQIYYRDAFTDLKADIRYIYTRAGLEQDIVLREKPPEPEAYGLSSATTRLEVFTEFVETPVPVITQASLSETTDPIQRASMALPDFNDQNLDFGAMQIIAGRAFPSGSDGADVNSIPTGKSWELRENRQFLIEAIQYPDARTELNVLPNRPAGQVKANRKPGLERMFPTAPQHAKATKSVTKMAAARSTDRGFVIDYTMTSGMTNFTFAADENYYVGGVCVMWGTNLIEGGTIIKFTNNPTTGQLRFFQGIECKTSPYRPAIFTSMDDDTVGATIAGSTGNPTNYAGTIQWGNVAATYFNLHDLRILHAYRAFHGASKASADVSNCQIIHTAFAFKNSGSIWNLRNVLVSRAQSAFSASGSFTNNAEHVTFHAISNFLDAGLAPVRLANSILIAVTNGVSYTGSNVETNLSDSGIFQTMAGGSFYLATNSAYRDAGTTNINSGLLSNLSQRTTFPPQWLSNTVTTNLVLAPVIPRDTNGPDLGYHYDVLDYYVSGLILTNTDLLITNGTAVGVDYSSSAWGFIMKSSKLTSEGGPLNLNRIVRTHMVQERSSGNPLERAIFYDGDSETVSNEVRLRFTHFAQSASDGYLLWIGTNCSALEWTHSAIYNSEVVVELSGSHNLVCGMTNTLWERGGGFMGPYGASSSATVHARNNLFKNSGYHFDFANATWTVKDNLVDGGGVGGLYDGGVPITNSHNAYYLVTNQLSGGTSNVTLTNLSYVVGPLGNYYQPASSGLINAGSTNADQVKLYHFTTTTNQVKELTSMVDIGPHWVALDADGLPLDYDGDGIADYPEDTDGNGNWDSGETDWLLYNTLFGSGAGAGLEVFTPLK